MTSFRGYYGWTLIELTVVLLILGVLAVAVAPRFGGSDGYHEHVYQARLISALRTMQLRAMHDTRTDFCFQINIKTGNNSAFGPPTLNFSNGNQLLSCDTRPIDDANAEYVSTSGAEMTENGVQILGNDQKVQFDALGCVTDSGLSCQGPVRIDIQGQRTLGVCIEDQGYIHAC